MTSERMYDDLGAPGALVRVLQESGIKTGALTEPMCRFRAREQFGDGVHAFADVIE
jgi:hypothetical protein